MIEGHCDCGGVAVRLAKAPNRINACPCGYCRQIGAQWSYFKPANVTVTGQTHGYTRAAHRIDFRRCATCGTLICWQPRGGDMSVMGVHMLLFPEKLRAGIPLTGDPLWDGAK
ncbi:hypothetical protein PARPLA_02276 [Rhodobacteraceae bacterium THAF1]|uniref:GFA family protein n=1 Tax=Palleronia sp. THAF1 TaxID=2587842 RepID=UPI000F3BF054|nr:aldehyde-activating protein [Palleronia sp. THAF1]QFU09310.1 hypothetical protein FIU81_11560 [Palleronia sp. THAF1]VDC26713.1 hypothetical protein PARPLA_02276 [Rhodobacteraceae bacterium THAF1]